MSSVRIAAVLGVLLMSAGCPTDTPPDPGDAGRDGGGADAGPDGGGCRIGGCGAGTYCELDGGVCLAGCALDESCPALERCDLASHACVCTDGRVRRDGGCVESCTLDETACEGLLEVRCEGGVWGTAERCAGGLCRDTACVPTSSCAGETPRCCAAASDCAPLDQLFSCRECRETVRDAYCIAGECRDAVSGSVDFTVVADAGALPDPTQVESGVVTVYRGVAADGRALTCEWLLADPGGGSPHDLQDPALNPTISRPYEFTGGTGSEIFETLLLGVDAGAGQLVVFTVYDDIRGRGGVLGRGCLSGVEPVDSGSVVLELFP